MGDALMGATVSYNTIAVWYDCTVFDAFCV